MKKIYLLIITVAVSLGLLNFKFNSYYNYTDKIVYENDLAYHDMSLEESKDNDIEKKNVYVQLEMDYKHKTKRIDLSEDATVEQVKKARKQRREELSKYYFGKNKELASGMDFSNAKHVYISKYGPYIEYEYEYNDFSVYEDYIVDEIIKDQSIKKAVIGYSDAKVEDELAIAMSTANAYSYFNNRTLTGDEVTIGILETGIMDIAHSNFANTDCTTFDNPWYIDVVKEHATLVAGLIGGSSGAAPDAKLLSAAVHGTYVDEIEWMIDNDVNIINMSFGETSNNGTRTSKTAYVDYISQQYDICVVAAAGNDETGETLLVGNPGMGYNVITVGSLGSSGYRSHYSCYTENEGIKPTIMIDGDGIYVPGIGSNNTGTSFSTAIVTGIVALLVENHYILTVQIPRISALLANSAYGDLIRDESNGFDDEMGAGIISLTDAIDQTRIVQTIEYDEGDPQLMYCESITVQPGYRYRFAISWAYGDLDDETCSEHTAISLSINDVYGNPFKLAYSTQSTIQVLDFTVNFTKTFDIRVFRQSTNYTTGASKVYLTSWITELPTEE